MVTDKADLITLLAAEDGSDLQLLLRISGDVSKRLLEETPFGLLLNLPPSRFPFGLVVCQDFFFLTSPPHRKG